MSEKINQFTTGLFDIFLAFEKISSNDELSSRKHFLPARRATGIANILPIVFTLNFGLKLTDFRFPNPLFIVSNCANMSHPSFNQQFSCWIFEWTIFINVIMKNRSTLLRNNHREITPDEEQMIN